MRNKGSSNTRTALSVVRSLQKEKRELGGEADSPSPFSRGCTFSEWGGQNKGLPVKAPRSFSHREPDARLESQFCILISCRVSPDDPGVRWQPRLRHVKSSGSWKTGLELSWDMTEFRKMPVRDLKNQKLDGCPKQLKGWEASFWRYGCILCLDPCGRCKWSREPDSSAAHLKRVSDTVRTGHRPQGDEEY